MSLSGQSSTYSEGIETNQVRRSERLSAIKKRLFEIKNQPVLHPGGLEENQITLTPLKQVNEQQDNLNSSSEIEVNSNVKMVTMTDQQFEEFLARFSNVQVSTQINNGTTGLMCQTGNFALCTHRYDGKREDYATAFVNAIKIYKKSTNMTDENALLGFPLLLEGEASIWWEGVKDSVKTFDEATSLLVYTFSVSKPPYIIYQEIFSLKQGDKETTDLFINKIRALFAKLPYGELTEKVQLDMCYGLLSFKIRSRLKRESFETFDKLLKSARAEEIFFRELENSRTSNKLNHTKINDVNNTLGENSKTKFYCRYCKSRDHNISSCVKNKNISENSEKTKINSNHNNSNRVIGPKTDVECYGCGKRGFVRANCPDCKTKSVFKMPTSPVSSWDILEARNDTNNSIPFSSVTFANREFQPRPIFSINIAGRDGTALVDTAAKLSIVSCSLYKIIKEKGTQFQTTNMSVKLADGSVKTELIQLCTLNVQLETKLIKTRFAVFPNATETVLGIEFLTDAGVVLDLYNRQWKFSDAPEAYPLDTEPNNSTHCSSFASDNHQSSKHDTESTQVQELIPKSGDKITHESKSQVNFSDTPLANEEFHEIDIIPPIQVGSLPNELSFRIEEGGNLNVQDKERAEQLLRRYELIFAPGGVPTTTVEHHIETGDHRPIAVPPYSLPPNKREILKAEIQTMLEQDIIEECESPWAAPVVLVPKPDSSYRFCVDYRQLNSVTVADRYPMPKIDDLLHLAQRTLYMSSIDLRSGYWQVPVHLKDRDKTAFICPFGLYRFKRMPFGVKNGPSTFQRLMDRMKAEISDVTMFAYLDDLIIISPNFAGHLKDLEIVFKQLQKYNLRANRKKCSFFRDSIPFLGHVLTPEGIQPNPTKVIAISQMPQPRNLRHLKTFLQTCSWYRKFIPDFAARSKWLSDLTKKNVPWKWTDEHQGAFDDLKLALVTHPILQQADPSKPYVLRTDASNYALGAVLLQKWDKDEQPLEYASRLLTTAEQNYSTTEREALAVVWALKKFQGYVDGSEVILGTDHQPLKWLMSLRSPSGRLARWALFIQGFNVKIEYVPGKSNVIADTLSRPPCERGNDCGICSIQVDLPSARPSNIRQNQMDDPEIEKIINCFESIEHPDLQNWMDRGYLMSMGVLYRYLSDSESEEPQLVIPSANRSDIMKAFHDDPTAGHYGVDRTLKKISTKYYWPGMRSYIASYIKDCPECQRYKPTNLKPAGLLRTPVMNQRFEVISIDLFGPLVESEEGYRWILIVEDTASRWVELYALKTATAEACSTTLVNEFFLRYGIPRRVVSDNGSQFVSAIMQKVLYCLGVHQALTPVYHPEANPVERKNRDLKTQLSLLVRDEHTNWTKYIHAIRFAMNTTVCESTGYTPAFICFGMELRHVFDVIQDFRHVVQNDNFIPEVSPYLLKIGDTIGKAREIHEKKQDSRKTYVDKHRRNQSFNVGDRVLVKTHPHSDSSRGRMSKFSPRREGPYIIKEIKSPTTYVIESLEGTPKGVYHVSMLTPINDSNNFLSNHRSTEFQSIFRQEDSENDFDIDTVSAGTSQSPEVDSSVQPCRTTRCGRTVNTPSRYR